MCPLKGSFLFALILYMAIDMSNAGSSSPLTSPRISFSYDLHQPDDNQNDKNSYRDSLDKCLELDDDFDFGFCINNNNSSNAIAADDDGASSTTPAEDLFLDGKIRSLQLQDKFVISKNESHFDHHSFPIPVPPKGISNIDFSNETTQQLPPENLESNKSSSSSTTSSNKVIKRSSSLHCDHTQRKSSFWLSLPLLSRSNSTGSVPKVVKENQNQNPKSKNVKNSTDLVPVTSSSSYRKPPLRKHYVGGYKVSNGMRISPVTNVPPPKITGNLFGFGAIFGSGDKVKKIKK